jgi:hypothetical protein
MAPVSAVKFYKIKYRYNGILMILIAFKLYGLNATIKRVN